jgi:hypothetical protein
MLVAPGVTFSGFNVNLPFAAYSTLLSLELFDPWEINSTQPDHPRS